MKGSKVVWVIYIFLLVLSCTVTISAMSELAFKGASASVPILRHFFCLILGVVAILFIQILNLKTIRMLSIPYLFCMIILLMIVYFTGGVNSGSSSRFSIIGQPSEYIKFGLILVVSELIVLVRKRNPFPTRFFYICMVVIGCVLMLIFLENLSSAIIIASIVIVMLLAGGMGLWRVGKMVLLAAVVVGCVIAFAFIVPKEKFRVMVEEHPSLSVIDRAYTWRARLERHFNKEEIGITADRVEVTDENRQEVYAKVALCRGGWLPSGPGSSLQRNYLPEAYSDYVFSIAAEEGGFLLAFLIILAYLTLFVVSLYYIIFKEQKIYRKLVLLGCSFSMTFQAAIHIAVSVGAMPVTGQTLPLVSRGGASLIVVSAMFGLIIKITAGDSGQGKAADAGATVDSAMAETQSAGTVEQPATETVSVDTPSENSDPVIIVNESSSIEPSSGRAFDDDDSIFIIED